MSYKKSLAVRLPAQGSRWLHKNGGTFEVVRTELTPGSEYPRVYYREAQGREFSRRLDVWARSFSPVPETETTPPEKGSIWMHYSGRSYRVKEVANLHSENPKYPICVVYEGVNGRVWSRLLSDWSRAFTLIAAPSKDPFSEFSDEDGDWQ